MNILKVWILQSDQIMKMMIFKRRRRDVQKIMIVETINIVIKNRNNVSITRQNPLKKKEQLTIEE